MYRLLNEALALASEVRLRRRECLYLLIHALVHLLLDRVLLQHFVGLKGHQG